MDGSKVIVSIPKVRDAYDLPKLSEHLVEIKRQYPQKEDASVLLEPNIPYDYLVQVMDTVRSVAVNERGQTGRADLFTAISIGDAP
jgi:hypothetical protein